MAGDDGRGTEYERALLLGSSPREVLRRLLDGDPLQIGRRTRERLSSQAHFFPAERASLRAMARTAYDSMRYRGDPDVNAWLETCVETAVGELLREQIAEEWRRLPIEESNDAEYYRAFARHTHVEFGLARLACVVINRQPVGDRRIFRAMAIDRASVEQCSVAGLGSVSGVASSFRRVVLEIATATQDRHLHDGGRST